MKMRIKVASQIFFNWSIAFMIKGFKLFKFTLFTISKVALEMTFELHRYQVTTKKV